MSTDVMSESTTWVRPAVACAVLGFKSKCALRTVLARSPIRCRRFPTGQTVYALEDLQRLARSFTGTTAPRKGA